MRDRPYVRLRASARWASSGDEGRAGGTDEKHAAIKSVEARERARGNSSTI
jgi:hypothetical protein